MKQIINWIMIIGLIAFLFALIWANYFPESIIGKSFNYIDSISSVILVVLTLAYVITTNRQLNTMKDQIQVMDKSFNHQVQPLLVPTIKKAYLEKLRAYCSPDDRFSTIDIKYRFHHEIELKNVGTGAALNITAYSSFLSQDSESKPIYFSRDQVHCLSTKDNDNAVISIMGLDRKLDILELLGKRQMVISTDIFYKNVFGAGFHEKVSFIFHLDSENIERLKIWQTFFESGIKKYDEDLTRFTALHEKLPKDSEQIHDKIIQELKEEFKEDLTLSYRLSKESFDISLINYNDEIDMMDKKHKVQFESYRDSKSEISKK